MDDLINDFRDAMAQVAAPVSIVTTAVDGAPFGATVSAFASLSLSPPMVLVALDDRGSLVGQIVESGRFGLNILGSGQVDASAAFATRGSTDRFTKVDWAWRDGLPHIAGSAGWVPCDVAKVIDGADHTLFLGRVLSASSWPAPPLVYYQRNYGTVAPVSA